MVALQKPWWLKSQRSSAGLYINKAITNIAGCGHNFRGVSWPLVLQVVCMNGHTWLYIYVHVYMYMYMHVQIKEFWTNTTNENEQNNS